MLEPPAPEQSDAARLEVAEEESAKGVEVPVHDLAPPEPPVTEAGAGGAGDTEDSAHPSNQTSKCSNIPVLCGVLPFLCP